MSPIDVREILLGSVANYAAWMPFADPPPPTPTPAQIRQAAERWTEQDRQNGVRILLDKAPTMTAPDR